MHLYIYIFYLGFLQKSVKENKEGPRLWEGGREGACERDAVEVRGVDGGRALEPGS